MACYYLFFLWIIILLGSNDKKIHQLHWGESHPLSSAFVLRKFMKKDNEVKWLDWTNITPENECQVILIIIQVTPPPEWKPRASTRTVGQKWGTGFPFRVCLFGDCFIWGAFFRFLCAKGGGGTYFLFGGVNGQKPRALFRFHSEGEFRHIP